ncbi:MAG: WXG100 family type VII secretion target [Actinocatenispora sp.]
MTANSGKLLYNHTTIQGACGDIDTFVNSMNTTLDDVEKDFNRLRSNWDSDSARQFDACKKRWNDGARNIASTLLKLKLALSGASDRMNSADQRAKNLFPG